MKRISMHDQEELSNLKYFFQDYGKYIGIGILVILLGYGVSFLWSWHQEKNSAKAAELYYGLHQAMHPLNKNLVYKFSQQLENKYPKTEYTAMGSLLAAKVAVAAKDTDTAITNLKFVIGNTPDKGMAAIAALRLANIYIDQHKFNLALTILMQKHDHAFDALFYAKRGDLYVVQGNLDKARDAYKEGLQKAANSDQEAQQMIQFKLDSLGGA